MKSRTEITVFDRGVGVSVSQELVKYDDHGICDKMQPFICRTIKSTTMTRTKTSYVLLVPFSVFQIVALMSESVNGAPADVGAVPNNQLAISEPVDKGVEILSRNTDVSDATADSSPVDYTLAIVGPIMAGIFLMVVVFFLYLVSEKNVASESTDYETLSSPEDEDETERPSTSGAAGQTQNQVEDAVPT